MHLLAVLTMCSLSLTDDYSQQSPLVHSDMQKKLISSDNGAADKNMAPKFIFDSDNIMEGNISESSSPEELLEV
jgi:hypothetical protein